MLAGQLLHASGAGAIARSHDVELARRGSGGNDHFVAVEVIIDSQRLGPGSGVCAALGSGCAAAWYTCVAHKGRFLCGLGRHGCSEHSCR